METTWPPAYTLRLSKKAKRVYYKILPNKGLELIVPIRQQKRIVIEDLLNEKKSWIQKHLANLKVYEPQLITELQLHAISQNWRIEYLQTTSTQIRHTILPGNILRVYGAVDNIERNNVWLIKWIKKIAQQHLLPLVQALSVQHDLPFNKAAIKSQQTMWGSCNNDKNINLNYKLIFLPFDYAKHVILHELCHTKHLNHSQRFWALLTKLDPNCDAHDRAIKSADQFIPAGL